ncbi:MAG TPA: glycosyltransferase family 39 protein, partial [Thermoanaerobaculia bacterium]|nr:glycosyltransferase family 39 protein [Thermoanaerobaculia bacterium]
MGFLPQSLGHALGAQPAGAGAYLVVLALLLAAYLPGRALAGAVPFASRSERIAVSLALGLVAEATLAFGLGLAGWFTPVAAGIGLALLQLPAATLRRRWAAERPRDRSFRQASPALRAAAAGTALGLLLLGAYLATLALYPPLGFDATMYHLPAAREMVESQRLPWLPDSRFPVFPQLNELLFALTLLAGDDGAARCLELALAGLVALGLYAWVAEKGGRRAGVWAGALWLGSPYVVLYGADAYVDVGLALFGFLAVAAVDRWGTTGQPRWAALAGVFAGAAAGVKYQGLFFVALVPIAVLVPVLGRERTGGRGRRARVAALALGAALLTAGPWYGRMLQATGNPVFPFFPEVFGESAWSPAPAGGETPASPPGALASRLRALALGSAAPWALWTGPPPFNPWLLALAPAALLLLGRPRAPAWAILLGLAYAPCSWLFAPDPRFLLPALAWAAAPGQGGRSSSPRRRSR